MSREIKVYVEANHFARDILSAYGSSLEGLLADEGIKFEVRSEIKIEGENPTKGIFEGFVIFLSYAVPLFTATYLEELIKQLAKKAAKNTVDYTPKVWKSIYSFFNGKREVENVTIKPSGLLPIGNNEYKRISLEKLSEEEAQKIDAVIYVVEANPVK